MMEERESVRGTSCGAVRGVLGEEKAGCPCPAVRIVPALDSVFFVILESGMETLLSFYDGPP